MVGSACSSADPAEQERTKARLVTESVPGKVICSKVVICLG